MNKQYIRMSLDELIPYANNPRINDGAVDAVAESMKQVGYITPIVIDENNVVLAGHTRIHGLKQLGESEVEVIKVGGLSEEQKKKYRILDNKTSEFAEWDFEKLEEELEGLDFQGFDFGFESFIDDIKEAEKETAYTLKTNIPQYEITGEKPTFDEMINTEKCERLIEEIKNEKGITKEERAFLIDAARRHNVFNYKNIAEYYAHATPEMQRLMEKSALVIIDINDAIANGYASLYGSILDAVRGDLDA